MIAAARGGCKQIAASRLQSRSNVRSGGIATSGFSREEATQSSWERTNVGMHGLGVGVAGVDGREMDLGVGGDGVGAGSR